MQIWLEDIVRRISPNCSTRKDYDPAVIVLHYDAGPNGEGAINWMCSKDSRASSHFHVDRDGSQTQLIGLDCAAWHAGVSEYEYEGEMCSSVNRFSIGVEVANCGKVIKSIGEDVFYYDIGGRLYRYPQRLPAPVEATLHYDNGNEVTGWWEPYSNEALRGTEELIDRICEAVGDELPVVGHQDVDMPLGRKVDPGPLFDWSIIRNPGARRTKP